MIGRAHRSAAVKLRRIGERTGIPSLYRAIAACKHPREWRGTLSAVRRLCRDRSFPHAAGNDRPCRKLLISAY